MPDAASSTGVTPPRPVVVAVVVSYQPDVATCRALLEATRHQTSHIVVVDNGSAPPAVEGLRHATDATGATLLTLGENRGVATAQNTGIAWAREHGADYVLLFDQDSLPADDLVERLLAGFGRAERQPGGRRVAAVGPVTMDERNEGAALLFSAQRWGPRRATVPAQDGALVEAAFLIASGSLIDVRALDVVGPMNDDWFIDHIDLEWGLRARSVGFVLYGVVGAGLAHSLGDRTQRIPGRRRDVHIHSPLRNYFMARNTVLLIRSGLMPWMWRIGYAAWITKYAAFYVLAVSPRGTRARLLTRGLWHGLRGRSGPYAGIPA